MASAFGTDRNAERNANKYADFSAQRHSNAHRDADIYADEHCDVNIDGDPHCNKYTDGYVNKYADRNSDEYTDPSGSHKRNSYLRQRSLAAEIYFKRDGDGEWIAGRFDHDRRSWRDRWTVFADRLWSRSLYGVAVQVDRPEQHFVERRGADRSARCGNFYVNDR